MATDSRTTSPAVHQKRLTYVAVMVLVLGFLQMAWQASPAPAAPVTEWNRISAGYEFTCGIKVDRSLWCWGRNDRGQVGDGTKALVGPKLRPRKISLSSNWAEVSTGTNHACAISGNKTLWCWGANTNGRLGDGTTTKRLTPTKIGSATTWATVTAGDGHTCATRTDRSLWCWGQDDRGQLGTGPSSTTDRLTPTRITTTSTGWGSVEAGYYHTCAIKPDATLWCWGAGNVGQLGVGSNPNAPDQHSPVKVTSSGTQPSAWASVSSGSEHTCATKSDQTLWCWGANFSFQLGAGGTDDDARVTPKKISAPILSTPRRWVSVNSGYDHTCATQSNHSLACWGSGWKGKLGNAAEENRSVPVSVAWGPRRGGQYTVWSSVSAGLYHTCAIKTDRTLACWGWNQSGEVGDGTTTKRSEPVAVVG